MVIASTLYLYANLTITAFEEKSTTPKIPKKTPNQNFFATIKPKIEITFVAVFFITF